MIVVQTTLFMATVAFIVLLPLRRKSSKLRHHALAFGIVGTLALPVLSLAAPSLRITVPSTERWVSEFAFETDELAASKITALPPVPAGEGGAASGARSPWLPHLWTLTIVCVWLLGLARGLGRLIRGQFELSRLYDQAGPASEDVQRQLVSLDSRSIKVAVHPDLTTPLVFGLMEPKILLPSDVHGWSRREVHAALLHELAHVEQKDPQLRWAAQILCALHWFNPLSWWLDRALRRESELAADDAVVRQLPEHATVYAEYLLHWSRPSPSPLVAVLGAEPPLAGRIRAVLDSTRVRSAPSRLRMFLVGVGLSLLVVACSGLDVAAEPIIPGKELPVAGARNEGSGRARTLQELVDLEAARLHKDHGASAVSIVVYEPYSGLILADRDGERPWLPGSAMKPLLLAAALEQGMSASDRLKVPKQLRLGKSSFTGASGDMSLSQILATSSNAGSALLWERVGSVAVASVWSRFGLEFSTSSDPGENAWQAIGRGVAVRPVDMAGIYGAIINGGVYVQPERPRSCAPRSPTERGRRVFSGDVARALFDALTHVVEDPDGTGQAARAPHFHVGGKTGTSRQSRPKPMDQATFVGVVRELGYVLFIGVERESGRGAFYGGKMAAPSVARMVDAIAAGIDDC